LRSGKTKARWPPEPRSIPFCVTSPVLSVYILLLGRLASLYQCGLLREGPQKQQGPTRCWDTGYIDRRAQPSAGSAAVRPGRIGTFPLPDGRPAAASEQPDQGERRLGWIAVTIAVGTVVAVGATLSLLLPIRDAADVSVSPQQVGATAIPDASSAPVSPPSTGSAAAARTEHQPATVGDVRDVAAPSTVAPTASATAGPSATVRPRVNATTVPAPVTPLPTDVQAAIGAVRAVIHRQIDAGRLDPHAGAELLGKVDQVSRDLGKGDWTTTLSDASALWKKLGGYRDDGRLSATGYQAIVAALQDLRAALSKR
jgi:hypothetical protein